MSDLDDARARIHRWKTGGYWHCGKCGRESSTANDTRCRNSRTTSASHDWEWRGPRVPEWWDWAVAAAQYHLPDCDWIKVGVSTDHCSCALTRVIARIIQEARRT